MTNPYRFLLALLAFAVLFVGALLAINHLLATGVRL